MAYADHLLSQAEHLIDKEPRRPRQASLRRAVSAAYYAIFHLLIEEAANFLVGSSQKNEPLRRLLSRAFEHGEMLEASQSFAGGTLRSNIAHKVGFRNTSPQLRLVAQTFVDLQQARHEADYELARIWRRPEALDIVESSRVAVERWRTIRKSEEARAFLVCLLTYRRIKSR